MGPLHVLARELHQLHLFSLFSETRAQHQDDLFLSGDLRQRTAESLGFHSVWTAEAWGADAITPLAWIGAQTSRIRLGTAIMQIPARTPAMAAMTAMSLDALSGGRFILGIGPSGPQVVEGWHGVKYGKPLTRTREYVQIIRQILRREQPVEFHGEEYDLPYSGPGATGLGKPLKSILHCEEDIPIYAATITPAMRKQLHGCVGGEVDPDSDNESLVVHVDRVASGEGARRVSVELETNPADGARLSLRKLVCLKKAPAGCDDE